MRLDNPLLVRWEYASEERLEKRNAVLRALSRGVDVSPRMVELSKARGLDARLADVEQLPYPDHDFDCAFAGWVLHHVANLERGVAECAPHFTEVERHDFEGELVFPDTGTLRTFVASTIDRAHLAPQVSEISEPYHARTRHVIFVAKGPR